MKAPGHAPSNSGETNVGNDDTKQESHEQAASEAPADRIKPSFADADTKMESGVPIYPSSRIKLEDRFIDEPRELRVAVVGGGLSGILAGILLPPKVPGIQLTIYEKNEDFGGTWFENVYPGVRCDVPSHVYQATFAPKTNWTDEFARGPEICDYWQAVSRKYDLYKVTKLAHEVEGAVWDEQRGKWLVKVRDKRKDEMLTEEMDFVLLAVGRFNSWQLPAYPGLSEYKGHLRHASNWDPSFDPRGKTVAVIGNGASGIQLVANLQKVVGRLDHYARSRTWVSTTFGGDVRLLEPQPISEDVIKSLEDPETYLEYRKHFEDKYWRGYRNSLRGSAENNNNRERFIQLMKDRLVKKPEMLDVLVPDFSPSCRRITPGPGYLEALTEDNVSFINAPIKKFTETGIETADGVHRDVDAVICATGANGTMAPAFPVSAHGHELTHAWSPAGKLGFPCTYLGLASPGFPNLLIIQGPHGTASSGPVPHTVENQLTYYAKLLRKVSREGIKSMMPTARATEEFVEWCDAFFGQTVLSDPCSSWYNGGRPGARIHGLWPGSAAHATMIRREPRWEDWEYEYLSATGNRFAWFFGKGYTKKEMDPASDMTSYLRKPADVDLREIYESWWDLP